MLSVLLIGARKRVASLEAIQASEEGEGAVKKRFHFLRFIVVLLKIVAALLLLAGIAGVVVTFIFNAGGAGERPLQRVLFWGIWVGAFLGLVGGVFYFIVFWGLADFIRLQLVIEENTRRAALRLSDLKVRLSAAEIGAAVAEGVSKALAAPKDRVPEIRPEPEVVAEAPAVEVAEPTPRAVGAAVGEAKLRAKEILDRSLEEAARQMAELEGTTPPPPEEGPQAEDDLSRIVGIGPVFHLRLREAGITTFAQVAAATPEELAAITEQSVDRVVRDDWIGQAKQLAAGKG